MKSRVLVVDDDEAIVDGLTALLRLEDIESAGACDRLSAQAMITGTFYPVIVADVRLHTKQQGLDLLDDIRRVSPQSRVISLTGFSTPELEHELRLRGSTGTITKPASSSEMIEAIHALLHEVERLVDANDTTDLNTLYSGARKVLFAIALRRYHLSAEEAEDAVQQTWLLFLEKRGLVENAPAWLAGTISNLCRRQVHRAVRSRATFVNLEALENIADPTVTSPDRTFALDEAMRALDASSRNVCRLIAVEGHEYAEVSQLTGLPLGSVGPMYLRAKKKMRNIVKAASTGVTVAHAGRNC
jgi:RNA polymerase sigma factor (sigma-70 family)